MILLCPGVAVSGGNKLGAVAANATLLQLNGFNADRAVLSSYPGEAYADLDKYISPEHYHDLGEFYSETWGYSQTNAQSGTSADFMMKPLRKM
jgi:hypothetical protein